MLAKIKKNMYNDLKQIIEVVNSIKDCDIQQRSRLRRVVDARRIYSALAKKICPKKTHKEIGAQIGVSHCMITHYLKNFEELKKQEAELRDAYKYCLEICLNMLGKKSSNYFDNLILVWHHLTMKQQKIISELATDMNISNNEILNK